RPNERKKLAASATELRDGPVVTLIVATTARAEDAFISRTVTSLADQLYGRFELVIAQPRAEVERMKPLLATLSDRVRYLADQRLWIRALDGTRGDVIGLVDFGDEFDPRALLAIAENVTRDPSI